MANKLFLWALRRGKASACTYYRVEIPVSQLDRAGLVTGYIEDEASANKLSAFMRIHSDIALHYGVAGEGALHNILSLKRIQPAPHKDGEVYPPTLIYDIDDNNDFVHPFNVEAFAMSGVRGYPDARLLKPGDGMEIMDAAGNVIGEWIDGEPPAGRSTKFDITYNLRQMKVRHAIISACHGVTVPSPTLARYMREVVGAQNVHVFPNTIVPEHYEQVRTVREDTRVRVLWQGGTSHYIDWYPLREAIAEVARRYPDKVRFVIFGEWFDWVHEAIPDEMVEHHPWVDYSAYKLKRGLLNIDVNLCPLVNNVFNACKSAIKWYEGAIQNPPEASLVGKSPTYDEVVDNETGLVYATPDEFVQKLSALIDDAALRRRIAEGARTWVLANRTPAQTLQPLLDFYGETRARHCRDLGRPIIKRPTLEQIKKVGLPHTR